jgi:hypothetical protein
MTYVVIEMYRNLMGWARLQEGKVLVEKRECTSAKYVSMDSLRRSS